MKNTDEIKSDALALCLEAQKRSWHKINIALAEPTTHGIKGGQVNYIYKYAETPYFLQQLGIINLLSIDQTISDIKSENNLPMDKNSEEIIYGPRAFPILHDLHSGNIDKYLPQGFYTIEFVPEKLKKWVDKQLNTLSGIKKKTVLNKDERLGIKGLFWLSSSPPAIFYEGSNKAKGGWKKIRGKNQSFATLYFLAKKINESSNPSTKIELPFKAVEEFVSNPDNCDRPMSWKTIVLPKRKARVLVKNIAQSVGFSNKELYVSGDPDSPKIVLNRMKN